MYLEHFGLGTNPFGLSPKLDFLFRSRPFEESIAHLLYGLDNSEAIVMITGAIGTGKTMAIQSFLSHLGPRFEFALVTNTNVDGKELLKLILEDFGLELERGLDKSDLLILFKEFLLEANREGKRVLVVIDEAQNLSREALEEVRLLTNLGQGESQPVQVILLGQPELVDKVNRDDLAQLRQRIRVHYHLEYLNRDEVKGYIEHRMKVAGCDEEVFTGKALDRILDLSQGVPRVINTLAGEALLSAFVSGRKQVRAEDVGAGPGEMPGQQVQPVIPKIQIPRAARTPGSGAETPAAAATVPDPSPVDDQCTLKTKSPPESHAARRHRGGGSRVLGRIIGSLLLICLLGYLYSAGHLTRAYDWIRDQVVSANSQAGQSLGSQALASQEPAALPLVGQAGAVAAPTEEPAAVIDSTGAAPVTGQSPPGDPAAHAIPVDEGTGGHGPQVTAGDPFYIHVSSFQEQERVEIEVDRLAKLGYEARSHAEPRLGIMWLRVFIGPFPSREAALDQARDLIAAGAIAYYEIREFESGFPD
ncbi:MAG: AAA family ATPase [bacterium]